ncbi:MAG: DUF302 domain-containing protein [Vicinamibacterales bacterium]|nr:DUF302 domain-containing protein [Vicinamibacterales bacterium]
MQATTYGIKIAVALAWDAAVARTTEALKAEGFGVLTTIDVQATLRTKLDREFRRYVILGACNAVLVLLVRSAEQVADAPDEVGELGFDFGGHRQLLGCWHGSSILFSNSSRSAGRRTSADRP